VGYPLNTVQLYLAGFEPRSTIRETLTHAGFSSQSHNFTPTMSREVYTPPTKETYSPPVGTGATDPFGTAPIPRAPAPVTYLCAGNSLLDKADAF
jgi:hypothetical protein